MLDTKPQLDPGPILQTAFAFWSSKVLLTAVEFGVFTKLGSRRITGAELGAELGLHPRAVGDFFDALVAMRFLEREGDGPCGKYFNTPAGALYLDSGQPHYIGGILVMLNARLFKFWHDLPEALRTGRPQNETKHGQKGIFEELYEELPKLEQLQSRFCPGFAEAQCTNDHCLGWINGEQRRRQATFGFCLDVPNVGCGRKTLGAQGVLPILRRARVAGGAHTGRPIRL